MDTEMAIADRNHWKAEAIKAMAWLGEMKILESQGIYIKLPCKVGDTIYDIYEFVENRCSPDITEYKAKTIKIGKDYRGIWFCIDSTYFRPDDIGKTVFLDREAAEKALKGGAAE
ncbi:MAG: hypothetical protein K0S04_318 [Herbinix sp.]|jgi:hypothetical protein|nr:hypothetical protein [Herbinix sp.]